MTAINELVTEFESVRKSFQEKAKELIQKSFKEFFEQNPGIEAIRWRQYTPYFNDGEPCEFCVHELYYHTKDSGDKEGDYDDGFESTWGEGLESAAVKEFNNELSRLPEDVFEDTFGDHCMVTATRNGFEVEEYDHD